MRHAYNGSIQAKLAPAFSALLLLGGIGLLSAGMPARRSLFEHFFFFGFNRPNRLSRESGGVSYFWTDNR